MECITDYVPDEGNRNLRGWNIDAESVEVYQASWVIEKARRIREKQKQAEQRYFVQFGGEE